MTDEIIIDGRALRFDSSTPIDISIPLQFNGPQPNAYGVERATSAPCVSGDLVGDTRQGGSCNFERYAFIPHCNGTHTECVGHITHERISVRDCLQDVFLSSVLVSVQPEPASETNETYSMTPEATDQLITRREIERSLSRSGSASHESLIVRSLPNNEEKLAREYFDLVPPYFTTEAIEFILELGVRHLLVDLPSIDRLYDEGRLSNHRIFWKLEQGRFDLTETARRSCTITEFVYVPNGVEDGNYLLNLQIAPFASDASPSRPVLFRILQN